MMDKFKSILKKAFKFIFIMIISGVVLYMFVDEMFVSKDELESGVYARQEFSDGYYYADIQYKNYETNFSNYYPELEVLIEGDKVKRIMFENGGYESSFRSQTLKSNIITANTECCRYIIEVTGFAYEK